MRRHRTGPSQLQRPGKVLVLFALLLPSLLGVVGVVIDVGMVLANRRQAQNAADAAALAAAVDLLNGKSVCAATTTAATYVAQYQGLPQAAVTVNVPPQQGPYQGNSAYVEVVVSNPAQTWFIQVLGTDAPSVCARAVAGYEATAALETVVALDPGALPGLSVNGAAVTVPGSIAVNSQGSGWDQNGAAVNLGSGPYGLSVGNGGRLQAQSVRLVGGADLPGGIVSGTGAGSPLRAGYVLTSDPLLYLPAPTTANGAQNVNYDAGGQSCASPQAIALSLTNGQGATLKPGVYQSITVSGDGSGTVTFNPGLYVLQGGSQGTALSVAGASVVGQGVMFYNTGSNYDVTTGLPDGNDGNTAGTDPDFSCTFGTVSFQATQLNLTPPQTSSSPFQGVLLYQRRWNRSPISIQGKSSSDVVAGTVYARWAGCSLTGPGAFNGQFLVGSLAVTGSGSNNTVTLNYGPLVGKANQVCLVE